MRRARRFLDDKGVAHPLLMGCYGIGIARLLVAAVEALHDDRGIVWPTALAPSSVVITPIQYTGETKRVADELYVQLRAAGIDVLLDDRVDVRPGARFADADLIGIPVRINIGERGLKQASVEVKRRTDAQPEMVPIASAVQTHSTHACGQEMNPTLDYSRKARDSDFVLDEVEEGVVLSFPIPPRSRFYLPMGIIVMAVCIELLVLVMMIRAVRVHWIYSRAHPSDIEAIALHSLVLVAGCAIAAVYYRNDRRWRNYRSSLSANRSGVTWQRRGTWGIRVTTFAASEIYGVAIRPIWVPWGQEQRRNDLPHSRAAHLEASDCL